MALAAIPDRIHFRNGFGRQHTMKPKRAALYLRLSTDGQTPENQRLALEAVAQRRGWTVVETLPG